MPLTQPQRIQISGEMVDLPLSIQAFADTQTQLTGVKAALLAKDASLKIFYDKFNDSIEHYQVEQRWANGNTYTNTLETDIQNSAKKIESNIFFPTDGSWIKFQPKKHTSSDGSPITVSPNHEIQKTGELTALLGLFKNGQTSLIPDDALTANYIPGAGTMLVAAGGQTVNNYIVVNDGFFSGMFKVTAVLGLTLTVTEIIPPNGTLAFATSVVEENITGFTNSERNTLTSVSYQNIITSQANSIIASVLSWETALNNQLAELTTNLDNRSPQASEIAAAITDINNAKGIIDVWQALPNTGVTLLDSKFVNVNLAPLESEVTARASFITTRSGQITTALGTVSQIPAGTYSGVGLFFERFNQINSRINLAGGPLTEYYEKDLGVTAIDQMIITANNTLATYNAELRMEPLTANATSTNIVLVASTTGLAVSNAIFIVADSLSELSGTITAINGLNITVSFTVPNTYTKALRARLYKQL